MTHSTSAHPVYGTLLRLGDHAADTVHGVFRAHIFLNLYTRGFVLALCRGAVEGAEPLLARVHSSCMTSESFGGCDCDCAGQLDAALAAVARAERGVVFYLMQEGRGAGFVAKARDRMMVQASRERFDTFDAYARMGLGRDHRRYDEVAFVSAALGIRAPLRLLTNNPDKVAALDRSELNVVEVVPIEREPSPFNRHYLSAKSRSGHALTACEGVAAEPPEPVEYFEPHPLAERPRFVRVASYLLPIATAPWRERETRETVAWFRLHAYFDLTTSSERVIFTHQSAADRVPLVRVQPESLYERLPLRHRERAARWHRAVAEIVRHGAGCVLFVLYDDPAANFGRAALSPALSAPPFGPLAAGEDEDVVWLLARHLGGGRALPLIDGPRETRRDRALRRALGREGIALGEPVLLADGPP